MWRRKRSQGRGQQGPAEIYLDLRSQVLELDPSSVGIRPTEQHGVVWGGVMEIGFPEGTATLVGLADGTTSMYTSTGGGTIGGGEHESVATATHAFLEALEEHLDGVQLQEAAPPPPSEGMVNVLALTYADSRGATVAEEELGGGEHALSPVFYAGHDVITALRQIEGI